MSRGLRITLVAAACAAAFLAGRAWPRTTRAAAPTAPSPRAPTPPSPATPTAPPTPTPVAPPPPPPAALLPAPLAGADTDDDFTQLAHADPDAAARLRSDVVIALEARRRAHNATLRACLDHGALTEDTQIRFAVDVHARDRRLAIGPAVSADVLEGPPLPDATLTCLLAALDARDDVDRSAADSSPVSFDGTIDVPIPFAAGPR